MKTTTKLAVVLAISIAFFITEISIGFKTKSLALIADAFHYLNDIIAYALAFVAAHLQNKGQRTAEFSFAFHRGEILGAFFNGVFLLALALSIFLQAIERFINVQPVDTPVLVLIVGCLGLFLNILSAAIMGGHAGHSHGGVTVTVEDIIHPTEDDHHVSHHHTSRLPVTAKANFGVLAVLVHLLGDGINNLGVIIAATIIWKVKSPARFYADPSVSLVISCIIFASALPLSWKSAKVLLEATPPDLDMKHVMADLLTVPGVLSIHDMHVWQLSQTITLATFHVCVATNTDLATWERTERILHQCCAGYGIGHVTVAPEIEHDPLKDEDGLHVARFKAACDGGTACAADSARHRKRTPGKESV